MGSNTGELDSIHNKDNNNNNNNCSIAYLSEHDMIDTTFMNYTGLFVSNSNNIHTMEIR